MMFTRIPFLTIIIIFLFTRTQAAVTQSKPLFDGDQELFLSAISTTRVYGEYGTGASTMWVLQHRSIPVLAVETDPKWADLVQRKSKNPRRLNLHHVDVGPLGSWGFPLSYDYRDNFKEYTDWIWAHELKPDTVLIDGRFRVACFLTCLKFATPGTKIILDDYERKHYHIIEEFVKPVQVSRRQALFVVPEKETLDSEKLEFELEKFRYVRD